MENKTRKLLGIVAAGAIVIGSTIALRNAADRGSEKPNQTYQACEVYQGFSNNSESGGPREYIFDPLGPNRPLGSNPRLSLRGADSLANKLQTGNKYCLTIAEPDIIRDYKQMPLDADN